jgi:hypothetical protein
MDYQFFKNINNDKNINNKQIRLYYNTLKPLINYFNNRTDIIFNLLSFINNYDEIIIYLNDNITNKNKMKLMIQSILYIIQYFKYNKNYIDIDTYNKYKNKYENLILLLDNNK